ncbi:MAG: ornithine carbamoyltransferase [Candidatus Njordarchaeales archaeon]
MLMGRDFLTLADFTKEEILYLLDLSKDFKKKLMRGEPHIYFAGKTAALLFEKPSTRTRTSLEVACVHLGIHPIYMPRSETQLARGEPVKDFARVLERYVDAIIARVYKHSTLEELAKYARIPVINALSDYTHPLQGLADYLTIMEKKGFEDTKIAYVGDGDNNVAHTLLFGAAILGLEIRIGSPKGYTPNKTVLDLAEKLARKNGNKSRIIITNDPIEAVRNADVIYTDVWVSMGQEKEAEERLKVFEPFRVTWDLVKHAAEDFIFMHCLPRHEEVTEEVFESSHSVVWDQAENRLHTAKAVIAALLPH